MKTIYSIEQQHDRMTLRGRLKRLGDAFRGRGGQRMGQRLGKPTDIRGLKPRLDQDEFRVFLYPLL